MIDLIESESAEEKEEFELKSTNRKKGKDEKSENNILPEEKEYLEILDSNSFKL